MNLIKIKTGEKLLQNRITPAWMSTNTPGGDEVDKKWEEKYYSRVKNLR